MKCPECEGVGWYETAVGDLLQSFDCDKCEGAGEVNGIDRSPCREPQACFCHDDGLWTDGAFPYGHCTHCGCRWNYAYPANDEPAQPHRDSGLPSIDTILEWQRLK